MRRSRWTTVVVVATVVSLALLAACRDVEERQTMPGQESPPGTLDACIMLTRPEVERITGLDASRGERSRQVEPSPTQAALSACAYDLGEGRMIELLAQGYPPGMAPDQALVWVRQQSGAGQAPGAAEPMPATGQTPAPESRPAEPAPAAEETPAAAAGQAGQEVLGLGNWALWSADQLHVANDDLYLVVTVTGFEPDRALEVARAVAEVSGID